MTDQGRDRVLGIIDLNGVTLGELEAWCADVFDRAGVGVEVSVLIARDHSHALAVDHALAEQVRRDGSAAGRLELDVVARDARLA